MDYQDLATRAEDYIAALATTLPTMRFEVYTADPATFLHPPLYIMGFHLDGGLIGGYELESPVDEPMFAQRVVSLSQFFQHAGASNHARFYPAALELSTRCINRAVPCGNASCRTTAMWIVLSSRDVSACELNSW